jgi:hypothetical protein
MTGEERSLIAYLAQTETFITYIKLSSHVRNKWNIIL